MFLPALLFINGCMEPSGGGGNLGSLPIILFIIIILLIPFIKAFQAAKEAKKLKTLVFVTTFYEWMGWIICCTIIGIPIGLGLVLLAQVVRLLIEIEKNTSKTSS